MEQQRKKRAPVEPGPEQPVDDSQMAVTYLTFEELKDFEDESKVDFDSIQAMTQHPDWRQ